MHNLNPFFKYGWLINVVVGAAAAGMVYAGVLNSEKESTSNSAAIANLQIDMSALKQEVHDIAVYIGAKKK